MILLDTDVVSFLFRGDSRGESYFEQLEGHSLAVSFMTAAELFAWAELKHWGERRRAELDMLLTERYTVLGFELGLAREWARIHAECQAAGKSIAVQDGWIVATARYFDLPFVTNNRKHYEHVRGVRLMPTPGGIGG